jgi:hypothetical protein
MNYKNIKEDFRRIQNRKTFRPEAFIPNTAAQLAQNDLKRYVMTKKQMPVSSQRSVNAQVFFSDKLEEYKR